MNKYMKSKNNDIQLFKFLYCWIIVLYHLEHDTSGVACPGGSFGVEYFLLSSGIFLFMGFERQQNAGKLQTPGQYLWKRFSRFFPWSLTGYLLAAVVNYGCISPIRSPGKLMDAFSSDIWEILMIKWNGMNENMLCLNTPAWTLSSLCIVGFAIWGFMYYYQERFLKLFMPISLIMGYGFWRHLDSASTQVWIGFTAFGIFRTWLVICLSYYVVRMAQYLKNICLKPLGIWLLTAAEVTLQMWSLWMIFNRDTRFAQWLTTLLMMLALTIALSGQSMLVRWLNKSRIVDYLGKLSMSVFLVHVPVLQYYQWKVDIRNASAVELIPLFAAIAVVSVCHYHITNWLIQITPKVLAGLRSACVEPEIE